MTSPAARTLGHRTLFKDLGEAYCNLNLEIGVPFYFGFPHERARIVGERLLGYRAVEKAGQWGRPLLPSAPRGRGIRLSRLRTGTRFTSAHDTLAERLHAREGWRTDRSREVLNWRFADRPGVDYRVYELVDMLGRSQAEAVVRIVMERALLVDLQAAEVDGGAVVDLLEHVSEDLRATHAIKLELRGPRDGALPQRLVRDLGFVAEESDAHLEVRPLDRQFDLDSASRAFDYRHLDHDIF
jgi:hypothetical protein